MHKSVRSTHLKGNFMSNNTTADVTGIFSIDTNRLVGLAAKGSPDVTYLAGQDTPTSGIPLTVTLTSSGGVKVLAGDVDVTDKIGGDGAAGTGMTYTARNLAHDSVTRIMLPSAPTELMLNWWDSTGSSGNLRYVLEAASLADATARLADDTAHGELVANGAPAVVKFEPTMYPVYIYVRASSAVGAGSNILSLLAKVTQ